MLEVFHRWSVVPEYCPGRFQFSLFILEHLPIKPSVLDVHHTWFMMVCDTCGSCWIDGLKIESLSWWGVCLDHAMWYMATKSGVACQAHIYREPASLRETTSTGDSLSTSLTFKYRPSHYKALLPLSTDFVQSFCSDVQEWQIENAWRTFGVVIAGRLRYICAIPLVTAVVEPWLEVVPSL